MIHLRIFCVWILIIAGLFAALIFKNDDVSGYGVVVAQEIPPEEQKIVFDEEMPSFGEFEVKKENKIVPAQSAAQSAAKKVSAVNINTAGMRELVLLPGIGETMAQRIIDFRAENGKFEKIDDIKKIRGIGEKRFEAMKNLLEL